MTAAAFAVAGAALGGAYAGNRARLTLAMLAIALGVALGFAVQTINRSALAEFTSGLAALSGDADFEVRGPRGGFDEALFAAIAGDQDVAVASPVVEVEARLPGRDEPLRVLGVDAFRAAAITPALVGTGGDRLDTLRPDRIFVSPAAAAALGIAGGDSLVVQSGTASRTTSRISRSSKPSRQRRYCGFRNSQRTVSRHKPDSKATSRTASSRKAKTRQASTKSWKPIPR